MSTLNNTSVQKHREKLTTEGCARLEITISRGVIDRARDLAQQKRCPIWQVVQDALIAYFATGNGK
jgi:hypothetical protein